MSRSMCDMTRVRKDVRPIWHGCLTDNKMSVQRDRRIFNAFLGSIITADRFKGVSHFVVLVTFEEICISPSTLDRDSTYRFIIVS